VYAESGFFDDGEVELLVSHAEGPLSAKLIALGRSLLRLLALLLHGQAKVVHLHVSSRGSFWRKAVFIWLAKLWRRRVIFHLHGGGFRDFIEGLSPLPRALALATIRCSDRILCLSSPVQEWLQALVPGVPVEWWPNPVPVHLFALESDTQDREPVLLFLGALVPAKGLRDLLQAFTMLHSLHPEALLVIGGVGPERAALQQEAVALGLQNAVKFEGWIDTPEKTAWLRRARILVLPSHLESQPMVLLEAMAAGAAVVSTDVGGVPDLVQTDEHGLLVPVRQPEKLAQALVHAWVDAGARQRWASQARQRVMERHGADQVGRSLRRMYTELAKR
jgi:glycosyltransferase involved in cell wall biosynthesis